MDYFEKEYIYPLIRGKCMFYTRYILTFFRSGKEQRQNLKNPQIKFDPNYSFQEINFLDTVVYKDKDCNLQTKVYRKPTNRTSLLHKKSAHPSATKTSIIYCQALRIKRICSEDYEMRKQFSVLKEKLLVRGK